MPFSREECEFETGTECPLYMIPAEYIPQSNVTNQDVLPGEGNLKKTTSNANYSGVKFLNLK